MSARSGGHAEAAASFAFTRWWELLPVRLALAVNLAAVAVLSAFWYVDYRRTRSTYLAEETRRLREEAKVLRAAQTYFGQPGEFQEFVDTFCQQMDRSASPGHHIAVFDAAGRLTVRAHQRPSAALEAEMAKGRAVPDSRFQLGNEEFLSVSVPAIDGVSITVAQSLVPVRELIRAQATSRAVSLGILALVILAVNCGVMLGWVHAPLRGLVRGLRKIGEGRFDVRVRPAGSAELRHLAKGVNEMAAALEQVDRDRREQMKRAKSIQARLLPAIGRRFGEYRIDATFQPAEGVGGDFYDVVTLGDGSALVVVLDVAGHGVAAALHTALLRTVLHYEAKSTADPGAIATAMNQEFASVTDAGEFATCCLVRLRPDGVLDYANAGHDPPLVVNPSGSFALLENGGTALGVLASEQYRSWRATLEPGARLYLYTDGLHEIPRPDGTLLGHERLVTLLLQSDDGPVSSTARIRSCAASGHFDDDVTLIRIQRE